MPPRSFRLPPELTPFVKQLKPNPEAGTCEVIFVAKGKERSITFPFNWDDIGNFEKVVAARARALNK